MRLLKRLPRGDGFELTTFDDDTAPPYAILSHTWTVGQEVTYEELLEGTGINKPGFKKLRFCSERAAADSLEYFWVDTCCINKATSVELSTAINSMFRWYQRAKKCYVYLSNVSVPNEVADAEAFRISWEQDFRRSHWFTRGWTLQELLAPASVEFFSCEGKRLGSRISLEREIHEITGIPTETLRGQKLSEFSVEERMSWAARRTTTVKEDKVYCLLGIFEVFLLPNYGEGEDYATLRLKEEIQKRQCGQGIANLLDLRSGSIFLQERLLARTDVQSFLTEAFSCSGHVRVILHGLPGIGKSTMARSFAYNAQNTMVVLWIPGNSEAAINQAFEQYARQICGDDQQYLEPMPLIASQLSQRFPDQWLVVFDGLDASLINIQKYLFADLEEGKILITTRNKDLASYVKATHVLRMDPLGERISENLLDMYMNTGSASLAADQAVHEEQSVQETNARRRIVKELGGLPLAIAIVGAALRKEKNMPSINSQAYLAWTDEVKDILLEQDPIFSDYSTSVWKAFRFAFQDIIQGTGINQSASFMAHFAASCDNASNRAEYIRLYRQFKTRNTAGNRSATTSGSPMINRLRFLENGLFELALKALAAANLITVNWMDGGLNDVPYIEMHSLVRRWLLSTNHDEVVTYTGPKMWLLGLGMYDQMKGSRVGAARFEPLLKEVSETLIEHPRVLGDSQVLASEAVFPLLLDAQIGLSTSTGFLPTGSAQRGGLHQFSKQLESQIVKSYDDNIKYVDWCQICEEWAQELGDQVEDAVRLDTKKDDYTVKDFFRDTLDTHGCIGIAFDYEAPCELDDVGRTDIIEEIKADIIARTGSLLVEHLAPEAFNRLLAVPPNKPEVFIQTWSEAWHKDVTEIVRNCLVEVFIKLQSAADTQHIATKLPSPSNEIILGGDQSFGAYLQFKTSDPRNAFFVVLRRTVKEATETFLESCPATEILNEHKATFRDVCERALRKGFNDRFTDAFFSEPPSTEAGIETAFGILWELAWPARFPGGLGNLIAEKTFNAISDDLRDAAKQGFSNTLKLYLPDSLFNVEEVANAVFSEPALITIFPNWITSGWIDPISDDEDSDEEEPAYINLMHESTQKTMSAMKSIYDNHANFTDGSAAVLALKSTLDWRKAMHHEVMYRFSQPKLTERTGMGPLLALINFSYCDRGLRLACLVLQKGSSEDFVDSLDHMINVEKDWSSFYSMISPVD
ncbi:hypothetical protein HBH98_078060 [Parastagonospora nodorum]|nr:hypothetical protein HBH51_209550 [Parastagonospora nodorum]KAH3978249.1 hypothetical protein HBH52_108420 [Parastagonospora nodorum]KAH4105511.1 hypothetical protein HBH46_083660 [Parastagonospora nodorum]KAH4190377.1 hypothetical protein HBH42_128130 [Parastagonospora nodorum]KAH4299805.1 hypothetical protein HBI01_117520 [Parastagonospora nodorum]